MNRVLFRQQCLFVQLRRQNEGQMAAHYHSAVIHDSQKSVRSIVDEQRKTSPLYFNVTGYFCLFGCINTQIQNQFLPNSSHKQRVHKSTHLVSNIATPMPCAILLPPKDQRYSANSSITQTICLLWKAELTNQSNIPQTDVLMSKLQVTLMDGETGVRGLGKHR